MKNIQQQIDIVSRLPDDVLLMKAQQGDPSIPQWAFVSEIDDRTRARKEGEANQQSQPKVADRVVQEGIAMLQPKGQPMPMQQPMQQPMQGMYAGGAVRMAPGGMTPYDPSSNLTSASLTRDKGGNLRDGFGNLVSEDELRAMLAYENEGTQAGSLNTSNGYDLSALNPFSSALAGEILPRRNDETVTLLSGLENSNSNLVAGEGVSPDIQRLVDMGSGSQDAGRINPMESTLVLGPDATDLKPEASASNNPLSQAMINAQENAPRNFDESPLGRKVANVSGALEDFNFPSIYEVGQKTGDAGGFIAEGLMGAVRPVVESTPDALREYYNAAANVGLGGENFIRGLTDQGEVEAGARYGDGSGRMLSREENIIQAGRDARNFFDGTGETPEDITARNDTMLGETLEEMAVRAASSGDTFAMNPNTGSSDTGVLDTFSMIKNLNRDANNSDILSREIPLTGDYNYLNASLNPTNVNVAEIVNPTTGKVTKDIPNVFYEDVKSDKAKDDMFSTMLMILGGSIMQNDLGGGLERAATAGAKMKADERARGEKALDRQITKDYYNQRLLDSQNTADQLKVQREQRNKQGQEALELKALTLVQKVIGPSRIEALEVAFQDQTKGAIGLKNTDPPAYEAAFNQYKAQAIRNYASGLQPIHQRAAEQLIRSLGVPSKILMYNPANQTVS